MRRHLAVLLAAAALAPGAIAQETSAALLRLPEPAGIARLVRPADIADAPLVIMLPDTLGADGREELYVDSLLARGIASLVLGLGEDHEHGAPPIEPAAAPEAAEAALRWAGTLGVAPGRIVLLGFGLGGRTALAASEGQPVVALYPRCVGLKLPAGVAALIVQGADMAEDCEAVAAEPSVTLRLMPRAGHAWDAAGAIWPSPGPVLPDPAGGERVRARTDGETTRAAADLAAEWIERALHAEQRSAAK